jgi:hypothetical protein
MLGLVEMLFLRSLLNMTSMVQDSAENISGFLKTQLRPENGV